MGRLKRAPFAKSPFIAKHFLLHPPDGASIPRLDGCISALLSWRHLSEWPSARPPLGRRTTDPIDVQLRRAQGLRLGALPATNSWSPCFVQKGCSKAPAEIARKKETQRNCPVTFDISEASPLRGFCACCLSGRAASFVRLRMCVRVRETSDGMNSICGCDQW